jgi:hypothetical protein
MFGGRSARGKMKNNRIELRHYLKAIKYLWLIANKSTGILLTRLENEHVSEIRIYFQFLNSCYENRYKDSYYYLKKAFEIDFYHWNMIKTFSNNVLPRMLAENEYVYVESIARELLEDNKIEDKYKKNIYLCLYKSLKDQEKYDDLAKIENDIRGKCGF